MNASSSEDTATSIVSDEDGNQGSVQSQTSEMGVVAGCMMPTERDITLLLEHSRQQQKSCQERYSQLRFQRERLSIQVVFSNELIKSNPFPV